MFAKFFSGAQNGVKWIIRVKKINDFYFFADQKWAWHPKNGRGTPPNFFFLPIRSISNQTGQNKRIPLYKEKVTFLTFDTCNSRTGHDRGYLRECLTRSFYVYFQKSITSCDLERFIKGNFFDLWPLVTREPLMIGGMPANLFTAHFLCSFGKNITSSHLEHFQKGDLWTKKWAWQVFTDSTLKKKIGPPEYLHICKNWNFSSKITNQRQDSTYLL